MSSLRHLMRLGCLAAALIAGLSVSTRAQDVSVELPSPTLRVIASDFDEGRNPIYCYFGKRVATTKLVIAVDSVSVVATPAACRGLGIGFVARISDPAFLGQILRGLIESSPGFVVVSAFYRTEDVEQDGERFRAARALSVVRGFAAQARTAGGS